jgi:hypothetical protein
MDTTTAVSEADASLEDVRRLSQNPYEWAILGDPAMGRARRAGWSLEQIEQARSEEPSRARP